MRRLVNFVRRSCAISLKPAKARYNTAFEQLKQGFRRILGRDLTSREEHLLELSQPILGSEINGAVEADHDKTNPQAA